MTRILLSVTACLAFAAVVLAPAAMARPSLVTTISVVAGKPSEFSFKLSKKSAKRGIITFKIVNSGSIPHDFKFCTKRVTNAKANTCTGRSTKTLSPGQSQTLRVTVLLKGSYEYLCTLPAHAASGMKGLIAVS